MSDAILITGATGFVGMATIRALSNQQNLQIRALVKDDDPNSDKVNELSKLPNVKIVHGNLDNEKQLEDILRDCNRALLVCPNVHNQVQMEKNFCKAAEKRKLELLIKVSILSPMSMVSSESPVGFAQSHAEVEKCLQKSKLNHVILRPNFFFENVLWFRDEINNERVISVPHGHIPATMVAVEDVGKVAAKLLSDRNVLQKFSGKDIHVCGPEPISFQDIAGRLSKRLGQEIRVKDVDSDTCVNKLKAIDLSEEMRKGMKPVFDEYWAKGAFNCKGDTDIPVAPSVNFDQWLEKNISLFQSEGQR
jgi:uncharacterized protein YbjT (DUF2867 family)